jgi:hypothetical protein
MKKYMKINKQKKSSFRRKDKNLRKKTLKKYHKKSVAKGKKQKGGIELSRVEEITPKIRISSFANNDMKQKQKGGKRRKEIQNMFLKANKFANEYIEKNVERVSSGGKMMKTNFINFRNLFNSKSEETIKKEQEYNNQKETEEDAEENGEEDAEENGEEDIEENGEEDTEENGEEGEGEGEEEEQQEEPNKNSKFSKLVSRNRGKEDPIEPDLSEHDSTTDDKIMINKEKDKYVWIRVNIPRDKDVLVQSDTSGTLEETLKTFKEQPAE